MVFNLTPNDWTALWLTLKLAFSTTLILMCLCLPLGLFLARWQSPWKFLVEAVATLPLVLPPTVLGYYLLVAFSPQHFLGQWYSAAFDQNLAFSYRGILIASVIYSLPFALRPLQQAFELQERQLSDSAALFGFSPWQTFFKVLLPNIRPATLGAATLCFAHTVGEFGVVLMIGGNIPGETQVVSVALFDHVENLELQQANHLALLLLGFSLLVVILSQWLMRQNKHTGGVGPC